jgi:hypothetical protein
MVINITSLPPLYHIRRPPQEVFPTFYISCPKIYILFRKNGATYFGAPPQTPARGIFEKIPLHPKNF